MDQSEVRIHSGHRINIYVCVCVYIACFHLYMLYGIHEQVSMETQLRKNILGEEIHLLPLLRILRRRRKMLKTMTECPTHFGSTRFCKEGSSLGSPITICQIYRKMMFKEYFRLSKTRHNFTLFLFTCAKEVHHQLANQCQTKADNLY